MDKIIFNEHECIKAKSILRTVPVAMKSWGTEFSPSRSIGKCTYLYKILQPTSYEDFYHKYVSYAEQHFNESVPNRGLTEKELIQLGQRYKNMTEKNGNFSQPLSVYVYDAICHIIIETYDGMRKEQEALAIAKRHDKNIRPSDYFHDSNYGMDMLSVKNDKVVYGIQIKPLSFFKSKRADVYRDRCFMCKKHKKALAELGAETFYMIYETTNGKIQWKTHEDGKFLWRFNDLVEYDNKRVNVKI